MKKNSKKKSLRAFLGFAGGFYLPGLAMATYIRPDSLICVTENWSIWTRREPFLYALLFTAEYFLGPLAALGAGMYIVYRLFKSGLAFIVSGGFVFVMSAIFAYFSIRDLHDPTGSGLVDLVGISFIGIFLFAVGIMLIAGHYIAKKKSIVTSPEVEHDT